MKPIIVFIAKHIENNAAGIFVTLCHGVNCVQNSTPGIWVFVVGWPFPATVHKHAVTTQVVIDRSHDSIFILDLSFDALISDTISASICDGDSYLLGTQTLDTAGIYTEVFQSLNACDSSVTINLTLASD